MKKLVSFGFHAIIILLLNSMFSAPFEGIASAQTDSVPRLAVSDEKIFIEPTQDKLTLYWAGHISFVKTSKAEVCVTVESTLAPIGSWQTASRNRFRFTSRTKNEFILSTSPGGIHSPADNSNRKKYQVRFFWSIGKRSSDQCQNRSKTIGPAGYRRNRY